MSGGPLGAVSPAQQGRSGLGGAAVWSSAWNGWINRNVAGGNTELGRELGPHCQGELSSGPDGAGRGPAITRPEPSHGSERLAPYTRLCPQEQQCGRTKLLGSYSHCCPLQAHHTAGQACRATMEPCARSPRTGARLRGHRSGSGRLPDTSAWHGRLQNLSEPSDRKNSEAEHPQINTADNSSHGRQARTHTPPRTQRAWPRDLLPPESRGIRNNKGADAWVRQNHVTWSRNSKISSSLLQKYPQTPGAGSERGGEGGGGRRRAAWSACLLTGGGGPGRRGA